MRYISSDTNVWIDYMLIGKIEYPFRLSYEYLMNQDTVCNELLSPRGMREKLIKLGLIVTELSEEEFYYAIEIAEKHPRLSEHDCAALAIAKHRGIALLTGDSALKNVAVKEKVEVIGTIGILDELFNQQLITEKEYKESLILLIKYNGRGVRLPQSELQKRLEQFDK